MRKRFFCLFFSEYVFGKQGEKKKGGFSFFVNMSSENKGKKKGEFRSKVCKYVFGNKG